MAVFADGSTTGTVGGGAVEFESIRLAKQALQEQSTFTHGFNLSPNQTADIGMICGGQVVVYFQYFGGGGRKGRRAVRNNRRPVLQTEEYMARDRDQRGRHPTDGRVFA
jgi:xanthine/CO dehydrogenase XdhC/CoxF family maturation factor